MRNISNIGPRDDTLIAYFTDRGLFLSTGCQVQEPLEYFKARMNSAGYKETYPNAHAAYKIVLDYLQWQQETKMAAHLQKSS